jgi:predicted Fe-Mo cluster-binding NifX family protein
MSKIAVPLFEDRVSPHFGTSRTMLLATVDHGAIQNEAIWEVGGNGPMEMARHLVSLGIQFLICGGIHRPCKDWLTRNGITVIENQKGKAKEVIRKWLQDRPSVVDPGPRNGKGEESGKRRKSIDEGRQKEIIR